MKDKANHQLNDGLKYDRQHIWHPYSSLVNPLPCYSVEKAEGVYITLESGEKLVDGMASWWCAIHGYNHPVLNQAINDQLQQMSHVMFGGLTHQPAIQLAEQLIRITPESLQTVFFCDSGSVAVEVAIKMAMQYWQAKGDKTKTKLLTIKNGYHGDTFAAMSVCDPVNGMHHLFSSLLPKHFFVESPNCQNNQQWCLQDMQAMTATLEQHHHEIAAIILEPIVQGAGGMRIYAPDYLAHARKLCDQYDVLLIADEIATGFGRTGQLFACEHANICPDIMCLGKAMTGGYLSMAATLATEKIGRIISTADPGVFMHGPTFMGNPLACAVSLASIQLLLDSSWQQNIIKLEQQMIESLMPCQNHSKVKDVRVLGAIGVIELNDDVDVASLQQKFVKMGVWIRPFRNLIYIMPPYIIKPEQLKKLTDAMLASL
ncbi:MAG: adenosylmethionine--8-amino-7-oxononanoate transaminase [Methylococcales bacterium]|jgi:adenosylmethionine---8-amino-7-oxononanoate aminotransferase|nr:adenosylmethionine--8-amino-7-oxononanoate transaminase [Methylococcales bacterium]MBT7410198.1 adenosylmethionine--8-amino-7-oxononanoate transaminase [Methylococcales bacterium]